MGFRGVRKALAIILIGALFSACAKTTLVPPADYGMPGSAHLYRIRTTDGRMIQAADFVVTDSTIVVTELYAGDNAIPGAPTAPFEVPRDEVASIEKVTTNVVAVVLYATLAAAALVVAVGTSGVGWGSGN